MTDNPLNQDINYLQGQIHGLQALVLALANQLLDRQTFQREGQQRLQSTHDALLALAVPEMTLAGIDAIETWLLTVTGR